MKKILVSTTAFLLLVAAAKAQLVSNPQGLDSIIVEKYYISDLADKSVDATGGNLPVNSVTYRIFVDMKPGYTFEALYGVNVQPVASTTDVGDHELRFETSTLFFNNEDRGATSPTYTKAQAANNTVMLDSWLSVGAACSGNLGVLKSEDDGVNNVVNTDGVLLNADALAGIPLTTQDGFLAGTPQSVTNVGIDNIITMFDAQNDGTNGPVFSTFDGAVSSLNRSTGVGTNNRVLVGQITTNGKFSFKLNVQLGTPDADGHYEQWVASGPVNGEGTHPTLTYMDSTAVNVGIKKIGSENIASFIVYPNPTQDMVTISITKTSAGSNNSYAIYGVDGKTVISKNLGNISNSYKEAVDLSGLTSGFYFVEVSINGEKSIQKVVKN